MAKASARMITREISKSKKLADLSPDALNLFCFLIPHFDSHGKMNGDPYFIKGEVCPRIIRFTIPKIEKCLKEISNKTNVKWFDIDDLKYIHSVNFAEHQPGLRADRMGEDKLPSYMLDISGSSPGVVPPEVEIEVEIEVEVEEEGEEEGEVEPEEKITVDDIVQGWNGICGTKGFSKVERLSPDRRSKINSRLKIHKDVEFWQKVFNKIVRTPFLMGKNDRKWKVTFDWLFSNDENSIKIYEGNYEQER